MSTFADRLREERVRLGFSQADFAALSGQQKQSQLNYEAGRRAPDTNYISALAGAGVDILYLMTGVRKTPGSPIDLAERAAAKVQDYQLPDVQISAPGQPSGAARFLGLADGDSASDLGRTEALRAGFLPLPWHRAAARAGSAPYAFSHVWLRENGFTPDGLSAIFPDHVHCANVSNHALIILDAHAPRQGPPAPWVAIISAESHLLDVEFSAPVTILHNFHPDGSSMIVPKEDVTRAHFLGRAIWAGYGLKG